MSKKSIRHYTFIPFRSASNRLLSFARSVGSLGTQQPRANSPRGGRLRALSRRHWEAEPFKQLLHRMYVVCLRVRGSSNHHLRQNIPASGLMVASRYPILAALFSPFTNKKPFSWQMLISYGVIVVKVDLGGCGKGRRRRIGFLANLHLMAFQGKEDQVS